MIGLTVPKRRKSPSGLRALKKEIGALAECNRRAEREQMTDADVQDRMCRIIEDSVLARGAVTKDDFLRENLPAEKIDANFKSCLATVRERNPQVEKALAVAVG